MTIKKFIRRNLPEIYVLSVFITVLTVQLAYECRGYFALGGTCNAAYVGEAL